MHVVRELVRHDDFDFVVRMFGQQRIRQQNPASAPDAGQRGVRLPGAVADVPLEHTEHLCAGSFRQRHEALRERRAL